MSSNKAFSISPLTLSIEILSLTKETTPLDLFAQIANEPWSMWLDSGGSDHVDACFDILVWQPEITLCTYGNETRIHQCKTNNIEKRTMTP